MQRYPKPDSIYINDELPKDLFYEDNQNKKIDAGLYFSIAIPIVAYEIKVLVSQNSNNIIEETVVNLIKLYESLGMQHGDALDKVAKKTILDRILVKTIWYKYMNNKDVETNEQNSNPQYETKYVFFDLYNKKLIDNILAKEDFDEYTKDDKDFGYVRDSDSEIYYRKIVGKGSQRCLYLSLPDGGTWAIHEPNDVELESLFAQHDKKMTSLSKGKDKQFNRLEYYSAAKRLWVITKVYISEHNTTQFSVANPFNNRNSVVLRNILERELESNPKEYNELRDEIEYLNMFIKDISEKERGSLLSDIFSDKEKALLIEVEKAGWYSVTKALREALKNKRIMEQKREAKLKASDETREIANQEFVEAKANYFISLYGLLENTMGDIFKKYQKSKLPNIKSIDFLSELKKIGFAIDYNNGDKTLVHLQKQTKKINNASFRDENLYKDILVSLCALTLQATMDEFHPLLYYADVYPDLPIFFIKVKAYRNSITHNDTSMKKIPSDDLLAKLEDVSNKFLYEVLLQEEVDVFEQSTVQNVKHNDQLIQKKVVDYIQHNFSYINCSPDSLHQKVLQFLRSYEKKSALYFSEAYNVLSSFMDLCLEAFTTFDERKIAVYKYPNEKENAAEIMNSICQKYFGKQLEHIVNPDKIRRSFRSPIELSPVAKIYILNMVLDNIKGDKGRRIMQELSIAYPNLVADIEEVTSYRGHNNIINFEINKAEIKIFHKNFLDSIESGLKFINEWSNKNGKK